MNVERNRPPASPSPRTAPRGDILPPERARQEKATISLVYGAAASATAPRGHNRLLLTTHSLTLTPSISLAGRLHCGGHSKQKLVRHVHGLMRGRRRGGDTNSITRLFWTSCVIVVLRGRKPKRGKTFSSAARSASMPFAFGSLGGKLILR